MDIPARHQHLITRLKARGLFAEFRRWAMGDTVLAADCLKVENCLECFGRMLYLCPAGEETWITDTCYFLPGNCASPPIQDEAVVEIAQQLLSSDEKLEQESRRWNAANKQGSTSQRRS